MSDVDWDVAKAAAQESATTEEPRSKGQASQLVDLAEARYRFATSTSGEPFAVSLGGTNLARMLRGGRDSLRAELAAIYAGDRGRVPSASALADALLVLEGKALGTNREDLFLRLAPHGEGVVLDLGDETGAAVLVGPGHWDVVSRSPVLFRRTELTGALPVPVSGGTLEELAELLNVAEWPLVAAWLAAALLPDMAHAVLSLAGEQGTGKSTAGRLLAATIDPSPAQLRAAPKDPEGWAVAAAGSWVVGIDNVSSIPTWLSDAMCRASTGEGVVRRKLYSDDSLSVLAFRRAVLLTSIDAGALRGDLADRLLLVELERIPAHRRRLDEDLASAFATAHPRILGAVLDLAADVLAVLPKIHLAELPRMADFARVLAAVDHILGTDALGSYLGQRDRIAEDVVEGDMVAQAVRDFAKAVGTWEGTSAQLLERITPDRPQRGWPRTPRALSGIVSQYAPALRSVGVEVERGERTKAARAWVIRARERGKSPSPPSPPSPTPPEQVRRGDGRGDGGDGGQDPTVTQTRWSDGCDGGDGQIPSPLLTPTEEPPELFDLPLDVVGSCRVCRETTVRTDGEGAICAPCHDLRWAS